MNCRLTAREAQDSASAAADGNRGNGLRGEPPRLDDEVGDGRLSARNDKYINRLRRHLDEIVDRYLPLLTPQHAAQ